MTKTLNPVLRLVIDNREPDTVFGAFDDLDGDVVVSRANLEHGDFVISRATEVDPENGNDPLMVIERKSLSDLLASVDDGRYRQQKRSLLEKYNRSRIYYVIETGIWLNGFFSVGAMSSDSVKRETAIGCVIGMMVRDDIKVFFTRDLGDTTELVRGLLKRFVKNYDKYFGGVSGDCVGAGAAGAAGAAVVGTGSLDMTKKRAPSGKHGVFASMLMMIPGVSEKTAAAIANDYKGFQELREAIVGCGGVSGFRDAMLIGGRRMSQKTLEAIWDVCCS